MPVKAEMGERERQRKREREREREIVGIFIQIINNQASFPRAVEITDDASDKYLGGGSVV